LFVYTNPALNLHELELNLCKNSCPKIIQA
jgi:hypothetical protein